MARVRGLLCLVVLCLAIGWVFTGRSYQSSARLHLARLSTNTPVPPGLRSESGVRQEMLSPLLQQRVLATLQWTLTLEQYRQRLSLASCQSGWDLVSGVDFEIRVSESTPQRSQQLCSALADQLSRRCLELSMENDQVLLELAKLAAWPEDHQDAPEPAKERLEKELRFSILAAQWELHQSDSGRVPTALSANSQQSIQQLQEEQTALEQLLKAGDRREIVSEVARAVSERRVELQASLAADHQQASRKLRIKLEQLKNRLQDARRLGRIRKKLHQNWDLTELHEPVLRPPSLDCGVVRRPLPGEQQSRGYLSLALLILGSSLTVIVGYPRSTVKALP